MAGEWREIAARSGSTQGWLTTDRYQRLLAGRPRLDGAGAAVAALGLRELVSPPAVYAERKQRRLECLIRAGEFAVFPDARRFVRTLHERGVRLAAASSSRNASALLAQTGLRSLFDVDVCGREVSRGKPDPALFLLAAGELQLPPGRCIVIEDASVGVQAARAARMVSIGVARLGDVDLLRAAGADLVVTTLDEVQIDALFGERPSSRRLRSARMA